MITNFRQGIAQATIPFLQLNTNSIDLIVSNPIYISFAYKGSDYLYIEHITIPSAWSITPGMDQWLYWDLNMTTGTRTFGVTSHAPLYGTHAPIAPLVDQHWFDTTHFVMRVWDGIQWNICIRTFAAELQSSGLLFGMGPNDNFIGSQVDINEHGYPGQIMYDNITGQPLISPSGEFITTSALDNIAPPQYGNSGKVLATDGFSTHWTTQSSSTISIDISGGTTGLSFTGGPVTGSGTFIMNGVLGIANGGTGATTADGALNSLLPIQPGHSGQVLTTNGINAYWSTITTNSGTVTSIQATTSLDGLSFGGGPITSSGTLDLSGVLGIASGGTGQTTTTGAINALLPSQVGNTGQVLATNGSDIYWTNVGTVKSVNVTSSGGDFSVTGSPVTSSGTINLILNTVPISKGGTGQTNATNAINALLPSQASNSGKYLTTNGATASWATITSGVTALSSLTDTNINSLSDGQLLQYQTSDGKWHNWTPTYISANQTITLSGDVTGTGTTSIPVTLNTVLISKGGTGQTNAIDAINALLPIQTTNSGYCLKTDGTNVSWQPVGSTTTVQRLTFGNYLIGSLAQTYFDGSSGVTIDVNGNSANVGNTLVARDAVGNFNAGTIFANLNGNASTVTNGVYTTGSYSDPSWITALSGSKISGNIGGTSSNVSGIVAINHGGTGQTNATAAFSALAPTYSGPGTQYLVNNGTTISWSNISSSGATTLNALTFGTFLNYVGASLFDGSTAVTISVNATSNNTASTIVSRDASGNFSAGTITATLNGNATGTASGLSATLGISSGGTGQTTAINAINALLPSQTGNNAKYLTTDGTNISWQVVSGTVGSTLANPLLIGEHLTPNGTDFDGSVGVTIATDATSNNTASTIVSRDASGNFSAGTITATLNGNATNVSGVVAIVNGGTGQTTPQAALDALLPSQTSNNGKYLMTTGSTATWSTPVTSVSVSGGSTGLTTSGGPITSTGTITLNGTVNSAHGGTGLSSIGGANTILSTNSSGSALEYRSFVPGSNISFAYGSGTIVISASFANISGKGVPGGTFSLDTNDQHFTYVKLLMHFNNNLTDVAGHTMTNNGTAFTSSQAKFDTYSVIFNGSSNYIKTATSTDFDLSSNDFTIETFILLSGSVSGTWPIISKYNNNTATGSWKLELLNISGTTLRFTYSTTGTDINTLDYTWTSITTATWYNICVTRVGVNLYMFINGSVVASANISGIIFYYGSEDITIGSEHSHTNFYSGYIDELRLTNGVGRYTTNYGVTTSLYPNVAAKSLGSVQYNYNGVSFAGDNNFVWDGINGRLGILNNSPSYTLDVSGTANISSTTNIGGALTVNGGTLNITAGGISAAGGISTSSGNISTSNGALSCTSTVTGTRLISNIATGTAPLTVTSTTQVNNLNCTYLQGYQPSSFFNASNINSGTLSPSYGGTGLTYLGTVNQVIGVTPTGGALEWKNIVGGTNISVVYGSNTITVNSIAVPGSGAPSGSTTTDGNDIYFGSTLLLMHFNASPFVDVKGNAITNTNSVTYNTSIKKYGTGSSQYNGSNWLVTAGTPFTIGTADFTIECWIYPTGLISGGLSTDNQGIFDGRAGATSGYYGVIYWDSPTSSLIYSANSGSVYISGGSISNNTWTHVAIVRANAITTMYIGGTSVGTPATDLISYASTQFTIGNFNDGGSSTRGLIGYMDDVRVTVYARYTSSFTPSTSEFPDAQAKAKGSIQYDYAGQFGGDTNFVWDGINGRLGILTVSPTQAIDVTGNIKISGVGNGLYFPDSTFMSTAVVIPTQTGNSGKFLTTNGTTTSWGTLTTSLSNLTDANIASPSNGQLLQYQTSDNKWHNWSPTYISSNQNITISGDASGSGSTSIGLTLASVNSNIGTYNTVTVNAKGLVTAASNIAYLTSNQNITISGDASGSGTTSIALTLATVPITKGGTGQTTATAALNALLPSQASHSGQFLTTDGTNASWSTTSGGSSTLAGLSDVNLTSTSNNQFLQYNFSSAKWVNHTLTYSDVPIMIASGSSHAPGLVPDPGSTAGSTRYLREDGIWAVPTGGGGGGGSGVTATSFGINAQSTGITPFLACSFFLSAGTYQAPKASIGSSNSTYGCTLKIKNGVTVVATIGPTAGTPTWTTAGAGFTLASDSFLDVTIETTDANTTVYNKGIYITQ